MDYFDAVLSDWTASKPDGVVLRASRINSMLDHVVHRIQTSSESTSQQRLSALKLLTPKSDEDGGLPTFVKKLRIDASYVLGRSGSGTGSHNTAVVHFVFFWQAMSAVCYRLCAVPPDASAGGAIDVEPFAGEVEIFRDMLIAHLELGSLTRATFLEELDIVRKGSMDESAWASLDRTVRNDPFVENSEQLMRSDAVSSLLLLWLVDVTDDYLRGNRGGQISALRDVLRCSKLEACTHLSNNDWDIELALRSYYAKGSPMASVQAKNLGAGWSSQSAKLRNSDLQCPLCVEDYAPSREPVITQCCFQSVCSHCLPSLEDCDGVLSCPFCRGLSVARKWKAAEAHKPSLGLSDRERTVSLLAEVGKHLGLPDHLGDSRKSARENLSQGVFDAFSSSFAYLTGNDVPEPRRYAHPGFLYVPFPDD